jgi:HEAT repeat protein
MEREIANGKTLTPAQQFRENDNRCILYLSSFRLHRLESRVLATLKQNHPILWRVVFIVTPFVAGVATHFALTALAPSYPQSIRNFVDANLQPLRELPLFAGPAGQESSTQSESSIDTLMKHYATLKSEHAEAQFVSNPLPEEPPIHADQTIQESDGATWNTTNDGANQPNPPQDMGNETDGPLYQLAESAEANTRIRALEALSNASNRQAVRACVEGLIDHDPTVRRHAARAMSRADSNILYREWVHVLLHGPPDLLKAFDTQIPNAQSQLESSALAGLASGESDRLQKLAAIYTLGRIRSDAALPLLTGYAWSGDIELGQTATAALAEIRNPDAVGALVDLTGHYDADVRWYAANGLGMVKGDDALVGLETIIDSGLEPLQEIRVLAIQHLADAKDMGSVPTLVSTMDRYPGLRYDAMYALAQITGIKDFNAPFQWRSWYEEWSYTPAAQAAARSYRQAPATQAAVMPVETLSPAPPQAVTQEFELTTDPLPTNAVTPPQDPEIESPPEVPAAPAKQTPKKPLQLKRTGNGGSFGTSDLSPAELMRQGGFSAPKP